MYGLTVQWSLLSAPAGTEQTLRDYVRNTSVARFTGMPGLHSKIWQMVDGGLFAGIYVWESAEARSAFLETFRANPSAVTQIVGSDPDVVCEWDVVGVAEGGAGSVHAAVHTAGT